MISAQSDASMCGAFHALLKGGLPSRVVWTADLTYWMAGRQHAGKDDPSWATEEGYLEAHRALGVMPYYYYPTFFTLKHHYDDTVEWTSNTNGPTTTVTARTPLGEISQDYTFLPESVSTGIARHFVSSVKDLDVLRYLVEHRHAEPIGLEGYDERMARWAQYDGFPSLGLPRSPLAALLVEWAGIENGIILLMDAEDAVRDLFAMLEQEDEIALDALCAYRPPLVHFPDNLSSENVTSIYDEWMLPTHRHRLDRLHAAGIAAAVHLDGTLRGLLPKLAAAGFDAIEALTPAPVGDVDVTEMRAVAANDRVILWGGVPGAMFAPPYTWDDMEQHVRALLDRWRGTPFVLGVADQVPPDGDIQFCTRIAELLQSEGA
jgi:hypothetical protein